MSYEDVNVTTYATAADKAVISLADTALTAKTISAGLVALTPWLV